MGKITIDQSHQVIATLAVNTDWESIDFKNSGLQDFIVRNPKEAGRQFTAFLKNGGKIAGEMNTIKIDRSVPFDPRTFLGKGWSIEEEDERALAITEVDLNDVRFEAMLKLGETSVNGEERLRRLKKTKCIRLDAKIFQTMWENQFLIPEKWKEKTDGDTTFIFFDGTELRDPNGDRVVLYLCWYGGGWDWGDRWLGHGWCAHNPSAVLATLFISLSTMRWESFVL